MGGCTASKLDNEDTVRHCKDRCRLMKEAVYARHHLAAAHSDYCRSLRITGSALVSFSAGESFSVSDETPAVFLRTPSSAFKSPPRPPPVRIPSPSPSIHPSQQPQSQHFSHSRSSSVASSLSSQRHQQLRLPQTRQKKPNMKLPHILSDSSLPTTPATNNFFDHAYATANSPSQASSVWNWENFHPPSPPTSEYFEQLQKNKAQPPRDHIIQHSDDEDENDDDNSSSYSQFPPPTIPPQNASFKQYDFFDNQSVNDEKASVHSSRSHPSNKGNLHSQNPILQNNQQKQHRSNLHNQDHILQNNQQQQQQLRSNLHNQDQILQNRHHHLQQKSKWENEREREELQYVKRRDFHNQDQNIQSHHFHHRMSNQDPILQKQDQNLQNHHHLQRNNSNWESEAAEREELHYSKRSFHDQDPILQSRSHHHRHHSRMSNGESEAEREEVRCSEWEDHDHYSTTSSGSSGLEEDPAEDKEDPIYEARPTPSTTNVGSNPKNYYSSAHRSGNGGSPAMSWGNGTTTGKEEMVEADNRMVVRHEDLSEIAAAIKSYFDMAASSGDQVCDMLEAGREQLDRNFKQLKKTVYHSSGILSSLSSSWSSKPPLAIKYKLQPLSISESGGQKSLRSTLDRLLAWEKKLYAEVKAREGTKIQHEKKLATLQSQEYRGGDVAKLDKTKADINKLQSLILVTSQAVTTTSSAIIGLRESDLVPQLVELCHGLMYMWRSMSQFHDVQNEVVLQVRGLINRATQQSTSDIHRQATRDLESAVSAWHAAFSRLIKFQRDFVRSIHGWFKLSLLSVDGNVGPSSRGAFSFCEEWKLALDRVPDTVASEALKSFINVVHSISLKQTEEVKIKKRTESVSKEMEKKESNIRSLERKFYNSYSTVGINLSNDRGGGEALDARDPLAEKKAELQSWQRRVEDEMLKHLRAVEVTRAMTLNNIQTGLPPVLHAMTSFSALFTQALEAVCASSYSI
ncbi:unnamed protein product [Cuscuta epithymum]|uniref:Uncharacterized protein n=1 Tax=Cuscuta epithymum TaxID=186058 RepID=A0AAV0GH43_9ASTE|nr:unnamed protein product [Cuscuta epithymum]